MMAVLARPLMDQAKRWQAQHVEMDTERAQWTALWEECAQWVQPSGKTFFGTKPGMTQTSRVYDNTAALALDKFSSSGVSLLVPTHMRWHGLRTMNGDWDDLTGRSDLYAEEATDALFAARYAPPSGFGDAAFQLFQTLGVYGSACMWIDEIPGQTLIYRILHPNEFWVLLDENGKVCCFHRLVKLLAWEVQAKLGPAAVNPAIIKALGSGSTERFEFLQIIEPDPMARYGPNRRWLSTYVRKSDWFPVSTGTYGRHPPFVFVTHSRVVGETYGRSPASRILPSLRTANEIARSLLRSAQFASEPVILAREDDIAMEGRQRVNPGDIISGGLDSSGNPMVQMLKIAGDMQPATERLDELRREINDVYLVTLFRILLEAPVITATEVLSRDKEKAELLAPYGDRMRSLWLGPMIKRELEILNSAGVLPDPPAGSNGIDSFDLWYDSPLSRMQQSGGAAGLLRMVESIGIFSQFDPNAALILNAEESLRIMAKAQNVPVRALNSREKVAELMAEKAQAAQMEQLLKAAPVAAQAAETVTRMGQADAMPRSVR